MSKIVIDVWGGDDGTDHLARFFRSMSLALKLANREIRAGYLVNMVEVESAGLDESDDFDKRHMH